MNWLKTEFQKVDEIDINEVLSDKTKKYLKFIHANKSVLADEPSRSDRLALQEAYGKSCNSLISCTTIIAITV